VKKQSTVPYPLFTAGEVRVDKRSLVVPPDSFVPRAIFTQPTCNLTGHHQNDKIQSLLDKKVNMPISIFDVFLNPIIACLGHDCQCWPNSHIKPEIIA